MNQYDPLVAIVDQSLNALSNHAIGAINYSVYTRVQNCK